ncbi:hypothetical protein CJ030_MR1G004251 [Morella rubra]|uniref:NusB/RsmB/TIM44 domain-containing protein n=1 Tax=Morella rubra TaxID=262757 RepID=A0A6A1WR01_9ROSI|nr:hypothetical protein CJ030_MR1G004251 [Morella rubra]
MEGSMLLPSYTCFSSSAPSILNPRFALGFPLSSPSHSASVGRYPLLASIPKCNSWANNAVLVVSCAPRTSVLRTSTALAVEQGALEKSNDSFSTSTTSSSYRDMLPKIDKSGRFCSPRAARELALSIVYAACLEGSDPVRLFEKRMNERREPGYEFDKASLLAYNHMSFGGPPISVETIEEARELLSNNEQESAVEAEVLAAPPKLVYSKLILRFTRKLLAAVVDRWDSHVLVIDKVAPPNWKNSYLNLSSTKLKEQLVGINCPFPMSEPAGRILELCILHLAMSEITVVGTRHQIVINEAVDLAKRFCDGAAPRVINGCLRSFMKDRGETGLAQALEDRKESVKLK